MSWAFFSFFCCCFSAGLSWSVCYTLSQIFSVRSVLADKASVVDQVPSFLKNRPPAHGTGRGPGNKGIMFGELSILLLLFLHFFRSVHGCMGMDVWVNVFPMPFLCADSGPWRKMSRAWPAMSAITTSSGSTCQSQQESAWVAVQAIQE